MELERMALTSASGSKLNLDALYQIMPSCFTEVRDEKTGKISHKINFTTLRELLGDNAYEGADEEYGFSWVGKNAARREAASSINKTLRPCPEESVDWDSTENLYIEGDNLEVLKLLQKSYLGKVKMIYIDPPYNTGNDFVYIDDFKKSSFDENLANGNVDEFNNCYRKNLDSNSRFHSDWCSMIYERLLVARALLSEDGVIFISIDENEIENLKKICNEIFGADNHINTITLNMSNMSGPKVQHAINGKRFPKIKEYILLYCKNYKHYKLKIPKELKTTWDNEYNLIIPELLPGQISIIYELDETEANVIIENLSIETLNSYIKRNELPDTVEWKQSNSYRIFASKPNTALLKKASEMNFNTPLALVKNSSGQNKLIKTDFNRDTRTARIELANAEINSASFLGDHWVDIVTTGGIGQEGNVPFENGKKPLKLLERVIKTACNEESIILDFFSGSATTAHAVMKLNAEDGGNRKFIMVQLPEVTDEKSEARKAGYNTICEIGKERIRRAGKKIKEEAGEKVANLDTGFRVFKCEDSFMNNVYFAPSELKQEDLFSQIENIKDGTSDLSLLFGCMLDWGVQLSLPLSHFTVAGKTIHNVNDGDLVACFAEDINEDVISAIAELSPLRVVFRDSCFSESAFKMNLFELFKQKCGWSEEQVRDKVRVI